jgi:predicted amidohydrolase YtcJ
MHAAIFRNYSIDLTKEPSKHPIFRAEERLTFREAIDLYTKAGAYAAGEDGRIGELRKGFMADFVVIDQKIWESDHLKPDETWHLLRNVQVKQLWVNGDLVLSK